MDTNGRCRTCLSNLKSNFLAVSTSKVIENHEYNYSELIFAITNINIPLYVETSRICAECAEKVEEAFHFRLKAVHTNTCFNSTEFCPYYNDNYKAPCFTEKNYERPFTKIKNFIDTSPVANNVKNDCPLLTSKNLTRNSERAIPTTQAKRKFTMKLKKLHGEKLASTINLKSDTDKNLQNVLENATCEESKFLLRSCPLCDTKLTSWRKLTKHLDTHIISKIENGTEFKNSILECELCKLNFPSRSKLKTHLLDFHGLEKGLYTRNKKEYLCQICGHKSSKFANHKLHLMIHTNERPYHCDQCERGFKQKYDLSKHQFRIHGKEFTGVSFTTSIRKIYSKKQFHCEYCGKILHTKGGLDIHVRQQHTKEGGFQCNECEKILYSKVQYKSHKLHMHTTPKIEHQCEHCGKRFKFKNYLNIHVNNHHNRIAEKEMLCDKCSYKTILRCNLNRHYQIVHNGEQRYPCTICERRFSTKLSCDRHILVHQGLKPYAKKD